MKNKLVAATIVLVTIFGQNASAQGLYDLKSETNNGPAQAKHCTIEISYLGWDDLPFDGNCTVQPTIRGFRLNSAEFTGNNLSHYQIGAVKTINDQHKFFMVPKPGETVLQIQLGTATYDSNTSCWEGSGNNGSFSICID